jgi:para-nitrobenzyl esterase
MRLPLTAALIALAAAALGCGSSTETSTPTPTPACPASGASADAVVTSQGALTGLEVGSAGGVRAFLGVPYAAPPLGDQRFRAPEAPSCFDGTFTATAFGESCKQLDAEGAPKGSEDCLTLNLWAPKAAAGPLPVLFFVHGGGNVQGSSGATLADGTAFYDGARLAEEQNVIVVTINYRLGALGFLALAALDAESPTGTSGNLGLLDQLAALRWVQQNIAAFGGDASRVLLFGESAGALDTCALVASPLGAGLFSAALMQSGGCVAFPHDEVAALGAGVAQEAGCAADDLPCLRALDADALLLAHPVVIDVAGATEHTFQLNVDGYVLPKAPLEAIAAGEHNAVPLVVGANSEETGRFVEKMSEEEYVAQVNATFGELAGPILAAYPSASYPSPRAAYVAITSDVKFICPARTIARTAAASQSAPVRRYFFTHALENAGAVGKALGATHGLELAFVFHHLTVQGYVPSDEEEALALAMGGYWARLGATGDPNGEGAVSWPVYESVADTFLGLDVPIAAGAGIRTPECDFWDALLAP